MKRLFWTLSIIGILMFISFVRAESSDIGGGPAPEIGKVVTETQEGKPRIVNCFRNWFSKHDGAKEETEVIAHSNNHDLPHPIFSTDVTQQESESFWLKEIAAMLSIKVSEDDQPGDIAFKIEQCLLFAKSYPGGVLSDASVENIKEAILSTDDAKTFEAYHKFIKSLGDKKILILNPDD